MFGKKEVKSLGLYSIYDSGADDYGPVFEAKTDSVARRIYFHSASHVAKPIRHEYFLYRIGSVKRVDTESTQIIEIHHEPLQLVKCDVDDTAYEEDNNNATVR